MNKKKKTLKGGLGRISKAALAIAVLAFLALVGVNGAIPKEAKAYTISDNYPKVEIMSSINNETIFSDVANHWAIEPIRWAYENGIVGGYADGTFGDSSVDSENATLEHNGYQVIITDDSLTCLIDISKKPIL